MARNILSLASRLVKCELASACTAILAYFVRELINLEVVVVKKLSCLSTNGAKRE